MYFVAWDRVRRLIYTEVYHFLAGRRGEGRGGQVLDVAHGRRSRSTIDPRIPTCHAGTEHVGVGTDQTDIVCTECEAKRKVFGESLHEG